MFTKNKVSQSMIDAVKNIISESSTPIKEPTATGMRIYGRSYGNSAKAKQDQTKSDLDKVKGPKDKEMKEAAKPDFLDLDGDKNEKESMKKAIADKGNKGVKEELKGNQHKIDANHNNKIDAQDFKILKAKKKVTEDMYFAKRLLEAEKMKQSPAKNQDIADKSYLKDKPGSVKSDLKNLGRFLTGKKETNEEKSCEDEVKKHEKRLHGKDGEVSKHVSKMHKEEVVNEAKGIIVKKEYDDKKEAEHGVYHNGSKIGYIVHSKKHDTHTAYHSPQGDPGDNDYGQIDDFHSHHDAVNQIRHSAGVSVHEEVELTEEQLDEMINEVLSKDASAGDWIKDFVHSDNPKFAGKSKAERKKMALGAYYGKQNEGKRPETDDAPPFEQPYTRTAGEVKDKSGAVHTPMSRAKDLARAAMKKVKSEMLGKTGTSESKKW